MKSLARGKPNTYLRQQRLLRGWSLRHVADELRTLCEKGQTVGVTADMVGKWERGENKPSPLYQAKFCLLYGLPADRLGFIEPSMLTSPARVIQSQPAQAFPDASSDTQPTSSNVNNTLEEVDTRPTIVPASQGRATIRDVLGWQSLPKPDTLVTSFEERSQDINKSRRDFLQTLGIMSTGLIASPESLQTYPLVRDHFPDVSEASITNLATITQQFREMQRHGDTFITNGLNAHIRTIQDVLERTLNDKMRRELWRIFAQTQLIARLDKHNLKKLELAQAKTLNESAIASAQNSGDIALVGACIGHLAHLYLREEHDTRKASQLIGQAQEYTQGCHTLNGWFTIIKASIAAKEGNRQHCGVAIEDAMNIAHQMSQTSQHADSYFTDFSVVSVKVFAGNCWLTAGEPKKAYDLLTSINMEELAINRHASAFYDISRAYAAAGQLEAAQVYALLSIDCALTTNHIYIIPRFIALAHAIQQKDNHEPHAAAIIEYAQAALQVS